ncbi:MAG: lipoyl(octanoyl) transferase LipB [Candidatus Omnitrophica bacterium]|nr:lipoyl(octanoyl) transferase LipB [Candidatus Omnitrophota bacterium]
MRVRDLGLIEFQEAEDFQLCYMKGRLPGDAGDMLIMAEHPPVVTLGRIADASTVPGLCSFEQQGISVIKVARGGKTTFHSPGQLLLYPSIDLKARAKDISLYIDLLEITIEKSLRELGVNAARISGTRGVWVGMKKIAFTGVSVKRWLTLHGAAVNINNELDMFRNIHPCGDPGIKVTSARQELGVLLDMSIVKDVFARRFAEDIDIHYGGH